MRRKVLRRAVELFGSTEGTFNLAGLSGALSEDAGTNGSVAVSAERECLRRWHAATAKPWPEADDDAIGLGMEYSRNATNEALVEAKKERA